MVLKNKINIDKYPLPWQMPTWETWLRTHQKKSAAALLLTGIPGLGKRGFALAFAQYLLCKTPLVSQKACQQCRSCHLFVANTHPDFKLLEPLKDNVPVITVDAIRDAMTWATQTAQQNHGKVLVLAPAETMNLPAANALLKTLEEPPSQITFMLVTDQAAALPVTIRSRCEQYYFKPPTRIQAEDWLMQQPELEKNTAQMNLLLSLADDAPLRLLNGTIDLNVRQKIIDALVAISQRTQMPTAVAVDWQALDLKILLSVLMSVLMDMVRLYFNARDHMIVNQDIKLQLQQWILNRKITQLFIYYDKFCQMYDSRRSFVSLNKQLLLEDILIAWQQLTQ